MIYKYIHFNMKLYSVVVILSMLQLPSADAEEDYWPVHTACNSDKIQVIYRSCEKKVLNYTIAWYWSGFLLCVLLEYIFNWEHEDPIQDIGFTFSSCSDILTQPYVKASFLLRQSIDELYLSVVLFHNGVFIVHHDEPICLANFPRFTFCGNRRGEMVTIQTFVPGLEHPLKGRYNFKVHCINQNGFQIACVNATAIFQ